MVYKIKASDPHGLNKGRGLKFCEGSQVLQDEEGRRTYCPKHYECSGIEEDNSSKSLNDKNCLTDFNGISTQLGLFYVDSYFNLLYSCFLKF